jgi:hypothetical protein
MIAMVSRVAPLDQERNYLTVQLLEWLERCPQIPFEMSQATQASRACFRPRFGCDGTFDPNGPNTAQFQDFPHQKNAQPRRTRVATFWNPANSEAPRKQEIPAKCRLREDSATL